MAETPSSTAIPLVEKKPMPWWFKGLAGITVIALIAVMGGILFTERWVEVIDDHLAELRQHQVDNAYYNHTSKDFQAVTPLESFVAFTNAHPILSNHVSAHFTERSINHNISTLSGKITALDHHTTPIEYRLIREDGEWRILSIRFLDSDK